MPRHRVGYQTHYPSPAFSSTTVDHVHSLLSKLCQFTVRIESSACVVTAHQQRLYVMSSVQLLLLGWHTVPQLGLVRALQSTGSDSTRSWLPANASATATPIDSLFKDADDIFLNMLLTTASTYCSLCYQRNVTQSITWGWGRIIGSWLTSLLTRMTVTSLFICCTSPCINFCHLCLTLAF